MKYLIFFVLLLSTGLAYSARDLPVSDDIDSRVEEFIQKYYPIDSGFVYTGTVENETTGHSDRDVALMNRICGTAKGRSPMCNNWSMYYSGKQIFEDAGVPRGIALGIMNAESNIGVNYAGTCDSSRNNWGGIKYKITDIGGRIKDQPIPNDGNGNKGGCWLYKFSTIEEYFRSKANTLSIGYGPCFSTKNPIRCISYAYVGNPKVAEQSRINNVTKIAQ